MGGPDGGWLPWRVACVVALWYSLAGITDTVMAECVRTTGLCALPCFGTFVIATAAGSIVSRGGGWRCRGAVGRQLALAGCALCCGFGAMQASVLLHDLRFTYALKTAEPLATVALAAAAGDAVTGAQAAAVVAVCCGAAMLSLGSSGAPQGSALAAALALGSNGFLSLRTVLARPLLQGGAFDPPRLFTALAACSAACMAPLALVETVARAPDAARLRAVCWTSALAGATYCGYNCLGFVVLRKTTSASYAVVKEMRCLVVYLWAVLWVAQPLADTRLAGVGFVVAVVGAAAYSAAAGTAAPLVRPLPKPPPSYTLMV
eukprot:TRINITY_DN33686_c0_g1_i1.p1 TRINITY_DN33686_c0_g1~~TRINITY_DN33686_c0_g1_i1.p1  ORF type:complete len:319 (+),score=57.36 TRINITY_DN33686_c0_g1_i1:68-1024(+)